MTKLMTRYRLHSTLEEMVADPEGEYVRYEDYAALQAAYDQMVRHHLRDHNVPVAEPSGCTPKLPPHGCTCWFMGKDDVRLDHDKDCPVRIRRELDQDFPENRNGDV